MKTLFKYVKQHPFLTFFLAFFLIIVTGYLLLLLLSYMSPAIERRINAQISHTIKFAKHPQIANEAVVFAVNRALLLTPESYKVSLQRRVNRPFDPARSLKDEFCSIDQVKAEKEYTCVISALPKKIYLCGGLFVDIRCRSIQVPKNLWDVDKVREKIIYAALNPCSFLVNPFESSGLRSANHLKGYLRSSVLNEWNYGDIHLNAWKHASCDEYFPINKVYVEIHDYTGSREAEANVVALYKITKDENGTLGGKYVRL